MNHTYLKKKKAFKNVHTKRNNFFFVKKYKRKSTIVDKQKYKQKKNRKEGEDEDFRGRRDTSLGPNGPFLLIFMGSI